MSRTLIQAGNRQSRRLCGFHEAQFIALVSCLDSETRMFDVKHCTDEVHRRRSLSICKLTKHCSSRRTLYTIRRTHYSIHWHLSPRLQSSANISSTVNLNSELSVSCGIRMGCEVFWFVRCLRMQSRRRLTPRSQASYWLCGRDFVSIVKNSGLAVGSILWTVLCSRS